MLSKLLQYARDILNFQPSVLPTDLEAETKSLTTTMVTTRRQSGSNSNPATKVSPILESLPQDILSAGSGKRRRRQVANELASRTAQDDSTPASTRKRQKLPMREKDEAHFERHTHIAIEIPVRNITQDDTPMWTAPEQIKSKGKLALSPDTSLDPQVPGAHSQDDDETENDQLLRPAAQKVVDGASVSHEISEKTMAEQEGSKKIGSRSVRKKSSSSIPVKAVISSNATKPNHKRFDSEEPAVEELGLIVDEGARVEEEDESSDDDDAPEAVATHNAQKEAKFTTRSAAKAAEEQEAVIRKKRKERDTQLKEQAKAASKKRKHTDDVDDGHAISTTLDVIPSLHGIKNRDGPSGNSLDAPKDNLDASKSGTIINKNKIPEFLPAEYLEDDPIEDQLSPPSIKQTMVHKSKKIKFNDPNPKKPKDRKKGSVIYRVAEAHGDGLLAPKAASNARSVKEAWLNGQRGAGGSMKVVKRGFFKSRN